LINSHSTTQTHLKQFNSYISSSQWREARQMWKIILQPKILSVFWRTSEQMRSSSPWDPLDRTTSCLYQSSDLAESSQWLFLPFSAHSSHFVVWLLLQMFFLSFVPVLQLEVGQSAETLLVGQLPFSIWNKTTFIRTVIISLWKSSMKAITLMKIRLN